MTVFSESCYHQMDALQHITMWLNGLDVEPRFSKCNKRSSPLQLLGQRYVDVTDATHKSHWAHDVVATVNQRQ